MTQGLDHYRGIQKLGGVSVAWDAQRRVEATPVGLPLLHQLSEKPEPTSSRIPPIAMHDPGSNTPVFGFVLGSSLQGPLADTGLPSSGRCVGRSLTTLCWACSSQRIGMGKGCQSRWGGAKGGQHRRSRSGGYQNCSVPVYMATCSLLAPPPHHTPSLRASPCADLALTTPVSFC